MRKLADYLPTSVTASIIDEDNFEVSLSWSKSAPGAHKHAERILTVVNRHDRGNASGGFHDHQVLCKSPFCATSKKVRRRHEPGHSPAQRNAGTIRPLICKFSWHLALFFVAVVGLAYLPGKFLLNLATAKGGPSGRDYSRLFLRFADERSRLLVWRLPARGALLHSLAANDNGDPFYLPLRMQTEMAGSVGSPSRTISERSLRPAPGRAHRARNNDTGVPPAVLQ